MKCWKRNAAQDSLIQLVYRLLLLSTAAAVVLAQEPTFRSQSNVVLVPVLVRDSSGHATYGLQAKDFMVEDNGAVQAVYLDEAPESSPLSLIVALQTGRRANREFPRIRGLSSMLGPILTEPKTQIAIVEFDSQIQLAQDFTEDASQIERTLQTIQEGDDGAVILDTVKYCVGLLNKLPEDRQRVLLLISETRDHGSRRAKIEDVVTVIGNSNTTVYSLTFSPTLSNILDTERGNNRDEMRPNIDLMALLAQTRAAMKSNTPKAIAAQTGGEYELFDSRNSFETHMLDFTNHLHSRYLLSFQPRNPLPGLHRLRVQLSQPEGMTVLSRSSYWASEGTQ